MARIGVVKEGSIQDLFMSTRRVIMSRQIRSYTLAPPTMPEVSVLLGRVEERDLRRRAESFNDWGGGIRRFRPRGGHQNCPFRG